MHADAALDRVLRPRERAARAAGEERGAVAPSPPRPRSSRAGDREPTRRSAATTGCAHRRRRRGRRRARRRARGAARASRATRTRRPRALRARARPGRGAATGRRTRRGRPGRRAACARPRGTARRAVPRSRAASAPPRRAARRRALGRDASCSHCSEPAADSITPIACHVPGTAWQNACTRASRSAAKPRQRREDDARRPEHDREMTRRRHADTERGGRLVARAGAPGTSGDSYAGGSHSPGSSSASTDLVAPPSRCATSKSSVPDASATSIARWPEELEAHVVLRQQDRADPREDVGLVRAQPEQLRRGEARQRAVAGQRDQAVETDARARSPRTRLRCAGRSRGSPAAAGRRRRRATTSPCICPDSPTAPTLDAERVERRLATRAPSRPDPAPPSPGAASTADTTPPRARRPRRPSSIAIAFTPVVPTSSPTSIVMRRGRRTRARTRAPRPCATAPLSARPRRCGPRPRR